VIRFGGKKEMVRVRKTNMGRAYISSVILCG